jgi:hypothetical protein
LADAKTRESFTDKNALLYCWFEAFGIAEALQVMQMYCPGPNEPAEWFFSKISNYLLEKARTEETFAQAVVNALLAANPCPGNQKGKHEMCQPPLSIPHKCSHELIQRCFLGS